MKPWMVQLILHVAPYFVFDQIHPIGPADVLLKHPSVDPLHDDDDAVLLLLTLAEIVIAVNYPFLSVLFQTLEEAESKSQTKFQFCRRHHHHHRHRYHQDQHCYHQKFHHSPVYRQILILTPSLTHGSSGVTLCGDVDFDALPRTIAASDYFLRNIPLHRFL